jgi:acetyltransferase-like isoleucine patch superfamily enzyme
MHHAVVGENCKIAEGVILGLEYQKGCQRVKVGGNAVIRDGTIIYGDVTIGDDFKAGHFVLIREKTQIGNNVLVGTHSVIEGYCTLGDNIKLQTGVYLPMFTTIGSNVFVGPYATFLNDKYPVRKNYELKGPVVEDDVSVGANATILPGIRIGKGAFIAAGAVVTRDVPPGKLARGNPAQVYELPEHLQGRNKI